MTSSTQSPVRDSELKVTGTRRLEPQTCAAAVNCMRYGVTPCGVWFSYMHIPLSDYNTKHVDFEIFFKKVTSLWLVINLATVNHES